MGAKGDANELKAHPFFADINWEALYNREIEAEYKPEISEEQKAGESLLIKPAAEGGGLKDGSHQAMGHSIMDEDAKEEVTEQQVEYVRLHQHHFQNF